MNNKGFAVSSIIYSILILFIILIFATLSILASRKLILDKLKNDVSDKLNGEVIKEEKSKNLGDVAKYLVYKSGVCKNDNSTYEYLNGCYLKSEPFVGLRNYVYYGNTLFRVMGINSDGSVKLISENSNSTRIFHHSYATFSGSSIQEFLNNEIYNELNTALPNSIVDGDFCQSQYYNTPSIDCSNGSIVTNKIGLLTLSEYNLSENTASYLNNGVDFWTMTMYDINNVRYINKDGGNSSQTYSSYAGVRPVINVKPNVSISSGTGISSSPYQLSGEEV